VKSHISTSQADRRLCRGTVDRRNLSWLAPVVGVVALFIAGCTNVESTTYRGQVIRKEVLRTEKWEAFSFQLAPSSDGKPRLLVTRQELANYYEVPVYQKVLELKAPDETDREKIRHRAVEGESIRGDPAVRNDKTDLGPWPNEEFRLNGVPVRSDAGGMVVDADEQILALFDDLSRPKVTVTLSQARIGDVLLEVSREDLLKSLGIQLSDTSAPKGAREGLRLKVDGPARVSPGKTFVLTLQLQNTSATPAAKVMCRTVSRHAWLDGKTFYFGDLGASATRSFSRTFTVPADCRKGQVFGAMGVWDLLGGIPDKALPLTLTVE